MVLAMTTDFVRELLDSDGNVIYFPNSSLFTKLFPDGLSIDNVMFTIPGINLDIYWYGFLIALGMVLAMVYAFTRCKKFGLDPDRFTDTVLAGLVGGIIGARLYYVIFSLSNYLTEEGTLDFAKIINVRDGGLAIYGGIIGGVLIGCIMAKIRKVRLLPLLDLAGMGFLIGQCLGRWGNFFNQEAYGYSEILSAGNLPWGMVSKSILNGCYFFTYPENTSVITNRALNMLAHPCFLYESLWCLLGFIILHIFSKRRKYDGQIFLMYIGWYGFGRFWIEALRTDSLYLINNDVFKLKVSQLLAGACFIFAVVMMVYMHIRVKKHGSVLYCNTLESAGLVRSDDANLDENEHILFDEEIESYDSKESEESEDEGAASMDIPDEPNGEQSGNSDEPVDAESDAETETEIETDIVQAQDEPMVDSSSEASPEDSETEKE